MIIDLSPLVNQLVLPLVGTVLTAFASVALAKLAQALHVTVSDSQRAVVENAIQKGIAFAEAGLASHENITVPDKVGAVLSYVLPKIPDALKWLGIDEGHLSDMIEARIVGAAKPAS